MEMRLWQSECISGAVSKFVAGQRHFLCLATPGAGKTLMAAKLSQELLDHKMADLVICFSPSTIVADDFRIELEAQTGSRMDGRLGSRGCSLTYQSMLNLTDSFWSLFECHRVFVIFDEIHHCAGHTLEYSNIWGQKILRHIQGRAVFTLALTGTPWRSDKVPIVLSRYCAQGKIQRDYQYGLAQAIREKVCRPPRIVVIDNDQITVTSTKSEKYGSFKELLESANCTYQQLLENDNLIVYLLQQSSKKLRTIRETHPVAGGLIVAASVEHARKIQWLLHTKLGEAAMVATYMEDDAQAVINDFRSGAQKWIISVGMISEGTNIPRLRICCHMTRVKTELHFRQVLGRILRASADDHEESYLFMPAEPSLIEYAWRVGEEVPEVETVKMEWMGNERKADPAPNTDNVPVTDTRIEIAIDEPQSFTPTDGRPFEGDLPPPSVLPDAYDATLNVFGRFKMEVLRLPF